MEMQRTSCEARKSARKGTHQEVRAPGEGAENTAVR
jgi:hypothetical protein